MPFFSEFLQWLATPSCVRKRRHRENPPSSYGVYVAKASVSTIDAVNTSSLTCFYQNIDVVNSFNELRCCDAGEPYKSESSEWLIELIDLDGNSSVVSLDRLRIEYEGFAYRSDKGHGFVEGYILCGSRRIFKDFPYGAVRDRLDYKQAEVEWCFSCAPDPLQSGK